MHNTCIVAGFSYLAEYWSLGKLVVEGGSSESEEQLRGATVSSWGCAQDLGLEYRGFCAILFEDIAAIAHNK
ncbi:hypothetical protein Droror1_Dr00008053, partial [Drosera rotundifolia]